MIYQYNELQSLAGKVVMADGCFDPLHVGHIRYFEEAAALGLPLFCNVRDDSYIRRTKNRPPLLPEEQRVELIHSLKPMAHVHLCKTSTNDVLRAARPVKYVKGADWKNSGLPAEEITTCKELGITVHYLNTNLDSSANRVTTFLAEANHKADFRSAVAAFESTVLKQGVLPSASYDSGYFMDAWRSGHNDYSVETRRAIEDRNPQNIKNVFQPRRVLDLGCGPGALMLFLHELGIETHGVDFSQDARRLAPPDIRERIRIGAVTEVLTFDLSFDLVICREVLEHLTVLQVRQAVHAMAKYTSRYLYITTRYFQQPTSLLDVGDDKKTDPTHITVLNKEFIRTLLVLEGMRSRPDLEAQIDWRGVGRVIVMEKVTF